MTGVVADRESAVAELFPYLRGAVSSNRRVIGHFDGSDDALGFANSTWAEELCGLGTSCPDHFLRTRISPMFVPWDPATEDVGARSASGSPSGSCKYREDYAAYYKAFAEPGVTGAARQQPVGRRDPGPGPVRLRQGQARGADHDRVLRQRHPRDAGRERAGRRGARRRHGRCRRCGGTEQAKEFKVFRNYVALPRLEAFRIEYWALEEAKLQRMPPEKEFSRKVVVVVGGASGIGREVALQIAKRGGHVVVADQNAAAAGEAAQEAAKLSSAEMVQSAALDLTSRATIEAAVRAAVLQFGGFDSVVNTAAIFPTPAPGTPPEETWAKTMSLNVTSNFVLAQEAAKVLQAQKLPASIVLTGSANAVVPKAGSEAYDVSKAAINHLVRELAVGLGPLVRVNAVAPATVVAGSAMFPRDRVIVSLQKYKIAFEDSESTEDLRSKLAEFYAQRTITKRPILPIDNANAICFLAGEQSAKTTGHIIPVDGGLPEAFLR